MGRALHQYLFKAAQQLQCDRRYRADMAGPAALRTRLGRTFQHAGANALTRHFEQTEMRDAPDLDSRAILPKTIAEFTLDSTVVPLLLHVDEINDDQPGQIAQSQLPRDL